MTLESDDTLQSLLGGLGRHEDRIALAQIGHGTQSELTYAQLDVQSGRLAAGLRKRGLEPGDRVLLIAPNSPSWLIACVGTLRAGLVPVPVDSQMGIEDLAYIASDSGARLVFTAAQGAERVAGSDAFDGLQLVRLDEAGKSGELWSEMLLDEAVPAATASPSDVAVIFYTSGTSGRPKGVPLTHENIVSNLSALLSLEIVHADDCLLLPLPLHHVYPFVVGLFTPLLMSMTLVVPSSLVGQHFFAALRRGRPTVLLGVPRLFEALYTAIEQKFEAKGRLVSASFHGLLGVTMKLRASLGLDLGRGLFWIVRRQVGPRIRLLVSGGSALDAGVAAKLEGLGFGLACGYGLTETSPILTFRPAGVRGEGHVGQALPGVTLRVAAPEAQFEYGEIQANGPNVFSGYLNLPDKTREAFTDDGWFRTGDLGYLDSTGYLYLRGRASSMIVMPGGENVDPEKVEQRLEQSTAIREAGVLEREGQLVGIIVPTPEAIRDTPAGDLERTIRTEVTALSRQLPSYQRLSDIVINQAPLPRTRLGKLRRRELISHYHALTEAGERDKVPGLAARSSLAPLDRELLEDRIAERVWAWLGERFEGREITPDTHMQLDLGVDSLEWLNLSLNLRNRAGIDLTDEAVGRIETIRDLLREAAGSREAGEISGNVVELLSEPDALLNDEERGWLEPKRRFSAVLDPLAAVAAKAVMRLLFRLQAHGLEKLPSAAPYIIAPNHVSALDPIAVAAAIGSARLGQTFWGGWVGILFRSKLSSALSHAMRILPVEPRSGPISNLALAAGVLHRGHNLVWFPEGRRAADGKLQRFRPGIGLLLLAKPVPIVPTWIEGAGEALPPGRLLPRLGPVTLRFGDPCDPQALEREGEGATAEERIANALQSRVAALGAASNAKVE